MQKRSRSVVERVSGTGEIFEGEKRIRDEARYSLTVSQEFFHTRPDSEPVEGLKSITGVIETDDIFPLVGNDKLTLHLEDGRRLGFFFSNINGSIAPTTSLE